MIKSMLEEKLSKEYMTFINNMKANDKDTIIRSAYKITVMEELILALAEAELDEYEVRALLGFENILETLYTLWVGEDSNTLKNMVRTIHNACSGQIQT